MFDPLETVCSPCNKHSSLGSFWHIIIGDNCTFGLSHNSPYHDPVSLRVSTQHCQEIRGTTPKREETGKRCPVDQKGLYQTVSGQFDYFS